MRAFLELRACISRNPLPGDLVLWPSNPIHHHNTKMRVTLDPASSTASLGEGFRPIRYVQLTPEGIIHLHVGDFITSALNIKSRDIASLWCRFKQSSKPGLVESFQLQTHQWPGRGNTKSDVISVFHAFRLITKLHTRRARRFMRSTRHLSIRMGTHDVMLTDYIRPFLEASPLEDMRNNTAGYIKHIVKSVKDMDGGGIPLKEISPCEVAYLIPAELKSDVDTCIRKYIEICITCAEMDTLCSEIILLERKQELKRLRRHSDWTDEDDSSLSPCSVEPWSGGRSLPDELEDQSPYRQNTSIEPYIVLGL